MKRFQRLLLLTLGLVLLLPALSMEAAPGSRGGGGGGGRGGGGRGGHGGGTRIIIGGGWGWGWGWNSWGWGYPGWYGYYRPGYGYGYPGYGYGGYGPSSQWAAVDTDVSPEEARVYLDGRYIGVADDFDGNPDYLYLRRGHYRLEFRLDGYETRTIEVNARPGTKLDITDKLRKVPGARQYGSYETPRLEGGVRRFWGRRGNATEEVTEDSEATNEPDSDTDGEYERPERPEPAPAVRERGNDGWRGNRRLSETRRPDRAAGEKARLQIHVAPSDAAVYVDDRFVGTAEEVNSLERGVAVSPGRHTIMVSRPGFKDRSLDVTVEAGESEKVDVSLGR